MKFPSTLLAQKAEPEEIQKADLDLLDKINKAVDDLKNELIPVGMIYTQLPGMAAPSTLWPFGTWVNVSSTFAGDFFRAEGGAASTFESGEQAYQNKDHRHYEFSNASTGVTTNPINTNPNTSPAYTLSGSSVLCYLMVNDGASGDADCGLTSGQIANGGTEARPVNQTIRIWKRTA